MDTPLTKSDWRYMVLIDTWWNVNSDLFSAIILSL